MSCVVTPHSDTQRNENRMQPIIKAFFFLSLFWVCFGSFRFHKLTLCICNNSLHFNLTSSYYSFKPAFPASALLNGLYRYIPLFQSILLGWILGNFLASAYDSRLIDITKKKKCGQEDGKIPRPKLKQGLTRGKKQYYFLLSSLCRGIWFSTKLDKFDYSKNFHTFLKTSQQTLLFETKNLGQTFSHFHCINFLPEFFFFSLSDQTRWTDKKTEKKKGTLYFYSLRHPSFTEAISRLE